jgi:hypothetical protein
MSQIFQVNDAPLELLDVDQLASLFDATKKIDTWLIDTFFPRRRVFNSTDSIPVADISDVVDIAPLVASHLPGKAFDRNSLISVNYVPTAYYKPKNQVTPDNAYDLALLTQLRDLGLLPTGSNRLGDAEKYMIAQVEVMRRNRESIQNAVVLQAAALISKGQIDFESSDFVKKTVSYGRDAALTFTPTTKWDANGADPVADIEIMAQKLLDKNGGAAKVLLLSSKAWGFLNANAKFQDRFVKPYAGISVPFAPSLSVGDNAKFKGMMDDIQIWTYDGTYTSKDGLQRIIPADFVGLIADTNGLVGHSKIKDTRAGDGIMEVFDKQWFEEDPSGITLLSQSAPVVVPSNKNGICGGTGFITV